MKEGWIPQLAADREKHPAHCKLHNTWPEPDEPCWQCLNPLQQQLEDERERHQQENDAHYSYVQLAEQHIKENEHRLADQKKDLWEKISLSRIEADNWKGLYEKNQAALAAAVEALEVVPEQLLESQKLNPAWSKSELWGIERDIIPSLRLLIGAALAKLGEAK